MSSYFPILITEKLQLCVNIKADSVEEAVAKAKEQWKNADFILDSEQFTGVEISGVRDGEKITIYRDKNGYEYQERSKDR